MEAQPSNRQAHQPSRAGSRLPLPEPSQPKQRRRIDDRDEKRQDDTEPIAWNDRRLDEVKREVPRGRKREIIQRQSNQGIPPADRSPFDAPKRRAVEVSEVPLRI